MATIGFTRDDFEVFGVPTFGERMQAIKARIRPRLIELGEQLKPGLAQLAKSEVYPYVAKHARRTVNPPPETWVAFGPSARGYKKYGYFGLIISQGGLHSRIVVKDEAENRPHMAKILMDRAGVLAEVFGDRPVARYDRWNFQGIPETMAPTADFWKGVAEGLAKRTGGMDVGVGWSRDHATTLTDREVLEAFETLLPLFEITRA